MEINLTDVAVIKSPMNLLQKKFRYLLNIQQKSVAEQLKTENENIVHILKANIEDSEIIFENFLNFENAIDEKPDKKQQKLFRELCAHINNSEAINEA